MTVLAKIYDRLDDGLNPILVKELRQAVKSRVVIGILFVFLVFQLMIVTIGITMTSEQAQWSGGKRLFMSQQIVLYFTILTALPAYCGARMLGERTDPGGDFMFLNSLHPATIVLGKLLASLAIGLLVFSVCAPFMTLAYLLRGIDLVTIFSILGFDLALMVLAMQFALFASALPGGLAIKRIASAAGFVGLVSFSYSTNLGFWRAIEFGTSNWIGLVPALIPVIAFFGYFLVYSIALVGSAASNGMFLVRLYLTAAMLLTWSILATTVWMWPTGLGTPSLPPLEILPMFFATSFVLLLGLQLLISTCERDQIGPRITRTIPKWPVLRHLAFLFYSGSAGGILYSLGAIAMTFGLAFLLNSFIVTGGIGRAFNWNQVTNLLILFLYFYFYAIIGYLLRTLLFSRWIKPEQTWILIAVAVGVLSTAPNVLLYVINGGSHATFDQMLWNITNPFYFFFSYAFRMASNGESGSVFIYFLGVASLGLTALAAPGWIRQFARFQRLETAPTTGSSGQDAPRSQGAPSLRGAS